MTIDERAFEAAWRAVNQWLIGRGNQLEPNALREALLVYEKEKFKNMSNEIDITNSYERAIVQSYIDAGAVHFPSARIIKLLANELSKRIV